MFNECYHLIGFLTGNHSGTKIHRKIERLFHLVTRLELTRINGRCILDDAFGMSEIVFYWHEKSIKDQK